jgi:CRISPR-associated protein Csx17
MMHIHHLDGCAPVPLAHYLKALGILRLVAEQADVTARGWWEGDRFRLATRLTADEIAKFLAEACAPLPVFNPWGGRSGFYAGSSETSARQALAAIERSPLSRLADYRVAIEVVRQAIADTCGGKKPADDDKDRLVAQLRKRVRGSASTWLDAVVAILGTRDGELDSAYPALFGTGGNEGSGSYTSAYMSAVVDCMLKRLHDAALPTILFGAPMPGFGTKQNMLQFLPEGAASPWDLLLAVAGASLIRSAVVARIEVGGSRWMASPFYVAPSSFGYASAARLDEFVLKQGKELAGRGEQWFPLWDQPVTVTELSQLFSEGRAANRRRHAADGWSMARAATTFGVRRGISAFQRYGYLQRDNQSLHFAVPLGRFEVPESVLPAQACLDDLDAWLPGLHRAARHKDAPARLRAAHRRLVTFLFDVAQRTDEPSRWQGVLMSLAEIEAVMKTGSGFKAQPVPPLRPEWVQAADDGSAELRLALALALQARAFRRANGRPVDPIRCHWLPLNPDRRVPRFATSGDTMRPRLDTRPEVVMRGRCGVDDAIALIERRMMESARDGIRHFPLQPAARASASMVDLSAWLEGRVDADRTLALARALMALDRGLWAEQIVAVTPPPHDPALPDDAWVCIRLAHLPWKLPDGRELPCDPAILRRLASGDAATAVELALRRLRAAGVRTGVRAASVPASTARLWAAALAFPVSQRTVVRLVRRLSPSLAQEQFA